MRNDDRGRKRWIGRARTVAPPTLLRGRGSAASAAGMATATVLLAGLMGGCAEDPAGPAPLESLPRELTAAEQEVISASNHFAFGLLREVDRTDGGGNLFLSPLSATLALGMTMNGAAGETFNEMRSTLGFEGLERPEINASYQSLMELILGLDPRVDTRIANSIWYRQGFPIEQSFLDTAAESFSAEVNPIAMTGADRATINGWVDRSTNGKIREIVDEIRDEHVMFLINAIYFKGGWTHRFDAGSTRDAPFHLAGGGTSQVRMMSRIGSYGYTSRADLTAVDLPYGNGAFSMTVLLPHEGKDVDDLVATLDADRWRELTASLTPAQMSLELPRFRIEYKQLLNDALIELGMRSAFGLAPPDFTEMSRARGRDLVIDKVLQKTYVEVNEEGTEAAAATSVGIVVVSMPPSVRVDRPFVFAIRERFSGTILFIGKVMDPS